MNIEQSKKFFEICAQLFDENIMLLSELDAAIADGDHGASMLKGFRAMYALIKDKQYQDITSMWLEAARLLMKEIGGTCGPLFATIFMKGAMLVKGKTQLDTGDFAKMIEAGSQGVMALGKAAPGEKTMVDALVPAANAMKEAADADLSLHDAFQRAHEAALAGAEATKSMLATKGRARYQKENAIGHQDAGATSVALIFKAFTLSVE